MAVLFGPQNIDPGFGDAHSGAFPMAGGARRDVLNGVVDADWIPGTDTLALIRDPGGGRPLTVEFPAGTTVHEARAAWSLRVSPDGVAWRSSKGRLVRRRARSDDHRRSTSLAGINALAELGRLSGWPGPRRDRDLVHGDAPRPWRSDLHCRVALGVERMVHKAPDWLVLHDISADGRVLLSRNTIRISVACQQRGDTRERDLTWQLASSVKGLTSDGQTLIFERRAALLAAPALSPQHGWIASSTDRLREQRDAVSRREVGARVDWIKPRSCCPPAQATGSLSRQETSSRSVRWAGLATRSASYSRVVPETARREATFRTFRKACRARSRHREWFSLAGPRHATTIPSLAALALPGRCSQLEAGTAGRCER